MEENEERPACPECGEWLSCHRFADEVTGEIAIELVCEGAGSDEFDLLIKTGLTNEDLDGLRQVGRVVRKEMAIELLARTKEPTEEDFES